jgi:NTE family protein
MMDSATDSAERAGSPIAQIDTGSVHREVESGMGLCLSGGGYRAMVFHLGALWRLNELGYLPKLERISSVSGGSITAAMLGFKWGHLNFDPQNIAQGFASEVVVPIRKLAGKTIDRGAILGGALGPGSIGDKVVKAYRKHLFGKATLQDLPDDPPRFVINATNVQSKALWRFMKPYMRDYRVGEVKNPDLELAVAVAASSAFPPFLSPVELDLEESEYTPKSGKDLQSPPFTTEVVLTDGGVYDNLGLETIWKRYDTILVSDAGGKVADEADPKRDWARHTYRVLNLIDNQVRSLRKRQVIGSYVSGERQGTYWGIRSNIASYQVPNPLPCPWDQTIKLADTPTRLKSLTSKRQEQLINWGYAICDAALRTHVNPNLPAPTGFPYPGIEVG